MSFHQTHVVIFGVMLLSTLALVFLTWHHKTDAFLPIRDEDRPRRIKITELQGKVNDKIVNLENNHNKIIKESISKPSTKNQSVNQKPVSDVVVDKHVNDNKDNPISIHQNQDKRSEVGAIITKDHVPRSNGAPHPVIPSDGGPRIFCMIFTTPSNWRTRAQAVRDTWAQRCHVYRFFYTLNEKSKPLPPRDTIALEVAEGRDHLTAKSMSGIQWAFSHYGDQVDWFFKADDDTFVIMENLRFVASQFEPSQAHYIGGRSMDFVKHGYNGGGAGYLLSHETARLIIEEGPKLPRKCKQDGAVEDLDIGICLEALHVYPIDTRDSKGRLTFHPDHPYKIWAGEGDSWRVYTYTNGNRTYGNPNGIRTMSPHTVSFHYVKPGFMYMYDFMLYHLIRHHFNEGSEGTLQPHIDEFNRPHT